MEDRFFMVEFCEMMGSLIDNQGTDQGRMLRLRSVFNLRSEDEKVLN